MVNNDGEVVYVEVTKDAYKRLRQHKEKELQAKHPFSPGDVALATILNAGLTEAEAYMWKQRRYDEFQPKCNGNRPSGHPGQAREA